MVSLTDVLLAMSNIPVDDPIAEIWGRGLQGGHEIIEYTGTLPITINADGNALLDYKIYGNTVQDGTPTPENPADVVGCGERTENLFDIDNTLKNYFLNDGVPTQYYIGRYVLSDYIPIMSNTATISAKVFKVNALGAHWAVYDENKTFIRGGLAFIAKSVPTVKVMDTSGAAFIRVDYALEALTDCMLNLGSTALPYEPYGYKLPILSNSVATNIYVGDTPLAKDEYVDKKTEKIYKFKEVHKDALTIDGIVWDILGYDHDEVYKEDGTLAQHTATIQTHDCIDVLQFDNKEALFAFPNGLAAGEYTFMIKQHTWAPSDLNKSITFTLTKAIPVGGQLVVNQAYNASFTTGTISSYASGSDTTSIETVSMSEGSTGTSLGDVTNNVIGNTNSCQRALLGSNMWGTSAIKQFINSDKAAGSVWTPLTKFDRPPSWAANRAGFLHGMDPDFVAVLGKVKKRTALNTVSDGGGYEDSVEKVFLLSRTEGYAGLNNNVNEGDPYRYFSEFSDLQGAGTDADTNRIKYHNGVAKYWWFRSPHTGDAIDVRGIYSSGAFFSASATSSGGVAPTCCIILDDISQNTWLQEHFLKAVDSPVPLPEIPTIAGTTVIDYDGELKPSQMYIKYRR